MRRKATLAALALAALLPSAGCASALTIGSGVPYGGALADGAIAGLSVVNAPKEPELLLLGTAALIDLPLSFAADTALLPITVPLALAKRR